MNRSKQSVERRLKVAYVLEEPTPWILEEVRAVQRRGFGVLICLCNWQRLHEVPPDFWVARASWACVLLTFLGVLKSHRLRVLRLVVATRRKVGLRVALRMCHFAHVCDLNGVGHIHAHFAAMATTVARGMAHLSDLPYSFTAHAYDIFKVAVDRHDLENKLEEAAFVRTVSHFHRDYLRALNGCVEPNKIKIIHYGVDAERFRPVAVERDRRFTILSIANLVPKKGLEILVDACALLTSQIPDFGVLVVGDGPLRAALVERIEKKKLQKHVVLPGRIDHHALSRLYNACDVFVLPCIETEDGDRDGMPNVLLEAMAAGKPAISSRVAGIPELIEDGVHGFLVDPGDARGVAEALAELHNNPARAEAMGRAGRKRILQRFDLSDLGDRLSFLFYQTYRYRETPGRVSNLLQSFNVKGD